MSFLVRPSMPQPNDRPDEIDGLLTRFFQAELPDPWPACPAPDEPAARVVPDRTTSWWELPQRFASRLSLALSLAVLLAGAWLLSGSFTGPSVPAVGSGTAAVQPMKVEIHSTTADRNHGRTPGSPNYKVNETLVQPKDGPTQMNIEIIDVGAPPRR